MQQRPLAFPERERAVPRGLMPVAWLAIRRAEKFAIIRWFIIDIRSMREVGPDSGGQGYAGPVEALPIEAVGMPLELVIVVCLPCGQVGFQCGIIKARELGEGNIA